ncbi:hypothetical protein [Candidatus Accumulibacter sp. ACC012]|nr:hypothetical protein [Candidatus Accumulibacter sp. ACC012]
MSRAAQPHSLHISYPEELHARTVQLLDTLEHAEDPTVHSGELGDWW